MRVAPTIWPLPRRPRWWWVPRVLRAQRMGTRDGRAAQQDADLGQTEMFEAFFRRFEPRITGYLWRMVNDEGYARDLCQETFLRAWQHFDDVQAAQQPAAWLFRVATNLALNDIRRRSSRIASAMAIGSQDDPAVSDPTIRIVERDFIQQILAELSPKQRALLVLREVYDLPFGDMSKLFGMSTDAVKMALCRARVQFRDRYLRKGGR